jgi:hypothetical protein
VSLMQASDDVGLRVQLEALERAAYVDLYEAAAPTVVTALGLAVAEMANGICLACSTEPHNPFMNRIRGLNADSPLSDEMLESAHAFFRSRSVRVFGGDVGPGSERDSVVERLIAHGFVPASRNAKLIRQGDLAPAARRDDLFEVVDR